MLQRIGRAPTKAALGQRQARPRAPGNLQSVSAVPKAPVWLARSSRCKTGPSKAVAGRSVVSVA